MKMPKSLEELLNELVSWLLFYPITMWRSVSRPLNMMRYACLLYTSISIIKNVGIDEREEIIVDFARWLETASKEALVYGEGKFAMMSASMAEAMRVNADELARDNPEKTERVLQQASAMMAQFKAAYPHRVISRSVH